MHFIQDFIDTLLRGDVNRLYRYFVPRFILAGLVLLALTFLGPFGILIALGVIAFVIYREFIR